MNILEKIIDFCAGSMFETEEQAENRELYAELNKRIKRIKRDNKQFIIENHIKPFLIAANLRFNNLLPTENELRKNAESEFKYAKKMVFVYELKCIMTEL